MPVLLPGEVPHRWQGHCYLRELFPTNTMSSLGGCPDQGDGGGESRQHGGGDQLVWTQEGRVGW